MGARDLRQLSRLAIIALTLAAGCGDNLGARHPGDGGGMGALGDAAGESDAGDALKDGAPTDDAPTDGAPTDGAPPPVDGVGPSIDGGDDAADGPSDTPSDASVLDTPAAADGTPNGPDASDAAPAPTCFISAPELGLTHPMLNGVPAAEGGDRVSLAGATYQVTFEVTTSVADNQVVELGVNAAATPAQETVYTAQVANGRARFPAVALPVDGVYEARARCSGKDGLVGQSDTGRYPVDTTPPELTVTEPHAGDFIPPARLTNGTFSVCGGTTSADAVNLDPALGPRSANGCVAAGGSPTCFAVPSTGTQGCLPVPCPGDAAFDIIVTLGDVAGNVQRKVIGNVSCFSTLPSVLIVSPVSDAPTFTDPSKHLLASTAPQAFRDNAAAAGAQTDVVACANRAGTIALAMGRKGDAALTVMGVPKLTRSALPADHCPAGFLLAVTFAGVTLPESTQAADTSLVAPTELRADLVDQSSTRNSSPLVDLWVDSVEPVLLITAPPDICNSYHQSNDLYISSETVTSTAPSVELTLTNSASTQNYSSESFTMMTFPFVVFTQGQTTLAGVARDAAGNVSLLQPNPCVVTVGAGPP